MSNKSNAARAIADAANKAAAEARARAIAIIEACSRHNASAEATRLILSGKSTEECEAELKQAAAAASWGAAVAKVNGQS